MTNTGSLFVARTLPALLLLGSWSVGYGQVASDRRAEISSDVHADTLSPHPRADPRHASGTSWQPTSSPHGGSRLSAGRWSIAVHGRATLNYVNDRGPRGGTGAFSTNMVMAMAQRTVGRGTLQLRLMASAEPTMGSRGYPLLLQTGETADGITPLVDRQHPHDLLMEVAAFYTLPLSPRYSLFAYVAPVGEPAIGPVPFMHRASGRDNPAAPITHHLLDATHITYGVVTAGLVTDDRLKLELSLFNGREPDQKRWGVEAPRLDSYALRATVNPGHDWSIQASVAEIKSPERVHPGIDLVKLTASVTHNRRLARGNWQTTVAVGRNRGKEVTIPVPEARRTFSPAVLNHYLGLAELSGLPEDSLALFFPSRVQTGVLVESALRLGPHGVFARWERARKDELFSPTDARHSTIFAVGKLTVGYLVHFAMPGDVGLGIGGAGSVHFVPNVLEAAYGSTPKSFHVFTRLTLPGR